MNLTICQKFWDYSQTVIWSYNTYEPLRHVIAIYVHILCRECDACWTHSKSWVLARCPPCAWDKIPIHGQNHVALLQLPGIPVVLWLFSFQLYLDVPTTALGSNTSPQVYAQKCHLLLHVLYRYIPSFVRWQHDDSLVIAWQSMN